MPTGSDLRVPLIGRIFGRLRFPQLFAVAAVLFVLDLLVPDLIPFVDEILLGLLTLLLGSLQRGERIEPNKPPEKDVTPRREG